MSIPLILPHFATRGVNVDKSPLELDDQEVLRAQNAVHDPQAPSAIQKRPGLAQFSQSSLSDPISGGLGVALVDLRSADRQLYIGWEVIGGVFVPPTPAAQGWFKTDPTGASFTTIYGDSVPNDPRTMDNLNQPNLVFTNYPSAEPLGGVASCVVDNKLIYADYFVANADLTNSATIRIFDGVDDRLLATVPKAHNELGAAAVLSFLPANGTVYVAVFERGTSSGGGDPYLATIYELNISTGVMTIVGGTFPGIGSGSSYGGMFGHAPLGLAWFDDKLWVGTHTGQSSLAGQLFSIAPGIDTDWALELDLTGYGAVGEPGITSLAVLNDKLIIATVGDVNSGGKKSGSLISRARDGTYTTVVTGVTFSSGTAYGGFLSLQVYDGKLYTGFWLYDGSYASIVQTEDLAAFTEVYVGSGDTIRPYSRLYASRDHLYAISCNDSVTAYTMALLSTPDGSSWTNHTGSLPYAGVSGVPVIGEISVSL